MRQIQLTRQAIKDLQRLQSTGSLKIPERLFEQLVITQEGENFPHTIHLSGYKHLWRSRLDLGGGSSLRLVFIDQNSSLKFLYADQRDSDTYDIDLNRLPQEPAYLWNGETGVGWSLFLNGAYNSSPLLTDAQQAISDQVGDKSRYGEDQRIGFFAQITQSPPGTGKTITAAIRACELYEAGWNVIFLLPKRLVEDIKAYHCIKSINLEASQGFFCGTFQDWIIESFPEVSSLVLTLEEELNILRNLADRAKKSGGNIGIKEIELRDVILFQSFILNSKSNYSKNSIYRDNENRIETLKLIKIELWEKEFSKLGKRSRSQIADLLCEKWECNNINLPTQTQIGNILIIDEAQDYLLNELKAIKTLCRSWHQSGHRTHLWLLGDLNQRIMPVDFDWGALELVRTQDPKWKCFRNSSNVLKFSNRFLEPVQQRTHEYGTRFLYQPADPEISYEDGDCVKLISYPSLSDTEDFLDKLDQSLGTITGEINKSCSLIHKLASRVKILQPQLYESKYKDRLEFLDVHEAKGREFDSCIVFNIFRFKGSEPISEDWWQWYTLLTRTRSRLLVIITNDQRELLLKYIPNLLSECEGIDFRRSESVDKAAKWIQSESNDFEFSGREQDLVERYLCDALKLETPLIYWDTFEVLDRIGVIGEERTNIEKKLLMLLSQYSNEVLSSKFKLSKLETKNPLIHCLILRAMGQYWNAIYTVEILKEIDKVEYERVIEAIANDLETINLVVEAARVRFQKLNIPYPIHLPMPQIAEVKGNLLTALINILKPRL